MGTTTSQTPTKVRRMNSQKGLYNDNALQSKQVKRSSTIQFIGDQQDLEQQQIVSNQMRKEAKSHTMQMQQPHSTHEIKQVSAKQDTSTVSTLNYTNSLQQGKMNMSGSSKEATSEISINVSNEAINTSSDKQKQCINDQSSFDNLVIEQDPIIIPSTKVDTIFQQAHLPDNKLYDGIVQITNQRVIYIYNKLGPLVLDTKPYPAILIDDQIYIGEWLHTQRNGFGRLLTNDSFYEGQWQNNQFSGEGRLIHANGCFYQGEFYQGVYSGKGRLTTQNWVYDGDWANGKRNGYGKEQLPDGTLYIGQFIDDQKHGQGKRFHVDQSVYDGEWKDDKYNGKGTMTWVNGQQYVGDWVNSMMHGIGKFNWNDNKSYSGGYKQNVRDGYGEYYWPDGKNYKGKWKNGLMHGRGVLVSADGKHKIGIWVKGQLSEEIKQQQ